MMTKTRIILRKKGQKKLEDILAYHFTPGASYLPYFVLRNAFGLTPKEISELADIPYRTIVDYKTNSRPSAKHQNRLLLLLSECARKSQPLLLPEEFQPWIKACRDLAITVGEETITPRQRKRVPVTQMLEEELRDGPRPREEVIDKLVRRGKNRKSILQARRIAGVVQFIDDNDITCWRMY